MHLLKILDEATKTLHGMAVKKKGKFNKYCEKVEKINKLLTVTTMLDWHNLALIEYWVYGLLDDELAQRYITSLKSKIESLYNHYNIG